MWREVREAVCVGWIRDSFLRSICLTVDRVQSVLFPRSPSAVLGRRVAAAAPTGADGDDDDDSGDGDGDDEGNRAIRKGAECAPAIF